MVFNLDKIDTDEKDYLIKNKDQIWSKRYFLNDTTSEHSGSMKSTINVKQTDRRGKNRSENPIYFYMHGGIEIRDCSRRIDLTIDGGTSNEANYINLINSKHKLLKIIDICMFNLNIIQEMEDRDTMFKDKAVNFLKNNGDYFEDDI